MLAGMLRQAPRHQVLFFLGLGAVMLLQKPLPCSAAISLVNADGAWPGKRRPGHRHAALHKSCWVVGRSLTYARRDVPGLRHRQHAPGSDKWPCAAEPASLPLHAQLAWYVNSRLGTFPHALLSLDTTKTLVRCSKQSAKTKEGHISAFSSRLSGFAGCCGCHITGRVLLVSQHW